MNKPIDYICRNTGAHGSDVMCSSCIPVYTEEQRNQLK